jgi:predicted ABC-type exoprotein transport system permease subunit
MAIEKLKTTTKIEKLSLKHSTHQNHKKAMNSDIPHIQHKEPEHKYLIFLTPLTPSVKKNSFLHVFRIFI